MKSTRHLRPWLAALVLAISAAGCAIQTTDQLAVPAASTTTATSTAAVPAASAESATPTDPAVDPPKTARAAGSVDTESVAAAVAATPTPEPPTPTAAPTPDADLEWEPVWVEFEPIAVSGTVRDVDFENGFKYAVEPYGYMMVVDGGVTQGEFGDDNFIAFGVLGVVYGDINGDGAEEAAVAVDWNGGGNGIFTQVRVFSIDDGILDEVGMTWSGDRAHGGLFRHFISDGTLVVQSFGLSEDGIGACCPDQITTNRWHRSDDQLRLVDSLAPQRLHDIAWEPEAELNFLTGTSSAVVHVLADAQTDSLVFEAGAGQELILTSSAVPLGAAVHLDRLDTGERVAQVDPRAGSVLLPASTDYRLSFDLDDGLDALTVEVAIEAAGADPLPTWSARSEYTSIREDGPFEQATVAWPELRTPAHDVSGVNAEIEAFVKDMRDEWIAALSDNPTFEDPDLQPEDIGSEFDLSYEIVMVSSDLVSIRFDWYEYVCCRPYPNYGARSLLVDLAAGRVLGVDEFVDVARFDQLGDIVVAAIARDYPGPGETVELNPDHITWDAIGIRSDGIEVTMDRGELVGAAAGSLHAIIPWSDLDGLIFDSIRTRAEAGRTLSSLVAGYGDECGC